MRYYGNNMLGAVRIDRKDTYMSNPYSPGFAKVNVPEGASGDWSVTRFTTDDSIGLFNLRLIRDGQRDRVVPPGTYTRLHSTRDGVVMSDTPAESHEHRYAYQLARGNVLVNGLGLGFYLQAILSKTGWDAVTSVTVIEKSPDVIKLVGPTYQDPRVQIICADAFEWKPPKLAKYDFAWHDIWPTICEDNKSEMSRLRRKYARRADFQRCWSQEYL